MEGEDEDRISDLPDTILFHIFYSISMKDIIRTSILSKRWKFLWTSFQELWFCEPKEDRRTLLLNVAEKALQLRDTNLEKFGLSCPVRSESDASRISQLISSVVSHKVLELDLRFRNVQGQLQLPCITSETLISLKLKGSCHLKLPSHVCFPNLKILDLETVFFRNNSSTQQLFNGCLFLEELTMKNCCWEIDQNVEILTVRLRKLEIINDIADVVVDANEVDYSFPCVIEISGYSLESLSFYSDFEDYYRIIGASSNAEASIQISRGVPCRDLAYRLDKLLRGLSKVHCLELCDVAVETLADAEEQLPRPPVFSNLTYLRFISWPFGFNLRALQKILQNTPLLVTVEFAAGIELQKLYGQGEWMLNQVPECFSTHLIKIIICDFSGHKRELHAIEMLLKFATVLEKLAIASPRIVVNGHAEKVKKARDKILLLPKASKDCVIESFLLKGYYPQEAGCNSNSC